MALTVQALYNNNCPKSTPPSLSSQELNTYYEYRETREIALPEYANEQNNKATNGTSGLTFLERLRQWIVNFFLKLFPGLQPKNTSADNAKVENIAANSAQAKNVSNLA